KSMASSLIQRSEFPWLIQVREVFFDGKFHGFVRGEAGVPAGGFEFFDGVLEFRDVADPAFGAASVTNLRAGRGEANSGFGHETNRGGGAIGRNIEDIQAILLLSVEEDHGVD